MKIIHVIPALGKGGAERLVLNICEESLKRPDLTVRLITFRDENAYDFLSKNIDWKVIPASVELSVTGKNRADVSALQEAIDQFQPDIIHSHLFEAEVVLSQIQTSAKRVVHFHDNIWEFAKIRPQKGLSKRQLTNYFERRTVLKSLRKTACTAIAISTDTLIYAQNNLPSWIQKIKLVNAIDLSRFHADFGSKRQDRLVKIGSFSARKGHELAIDTLGELHKRGYKIHLDLLGAGALHLEIEDQVKRLNLTEWVHFHGNTDFPETFLQEAKIYLHTAKFEAFGLALVEAMSAGLPIVCANGGGNKDLINPNENGFLIEDRDPTLFADKIILLLENEEERLRMAENAQETASQYGLENYIVGLKSLYESLLL